MNYLFWICWTGEMIAALFWVGSEMKLQYIKPNPFAFVSVLYLVIVMAIRFGTTNTAVSAWMVIIPAAPFVLLLLIGIIHTLTGGRWN